MTFALSFWWEKSGTIRRNHRCSRHFWELTQRFKGPIKGKLDDSFSIFLSSPVGVVLEYSQADHVIAFVDISAMMVGNTIRVKHMYLILHFIFAAD